MIFTKLSIIFNIKTDINVELATLKNTTGRINKCSTKLIFTICVTIVLR